MEHAEYFQLKLLAETPAVLSLKHTFMDILTTLFDVSTFSEEDH
jgi:hypothetical protein